jgi:hypothetical protein
MSPQLPRKPRQDRPFPEQHEEWMAHLRRQVVSRRTVVRGAVGAAAGSLLLGSSRWSGQAVAAVLADTGTVAGGFVVNGRHLSFGDDPTTQMWVGGQLFNITRYNAVPPRSVRVWVDYGTDSFYGCTVEAEIRELLTHVPVWDGKPGALRASRTLNADQFFVHARKAGLSPGTQYHYRFRYASGSEIGVTADATFLTAPGQVSEPFTFTAFADEGIPGPSLDRDPSLLPESDWGMWNNGSYDSGDPDRPARTHVDTTSAVIRQIMKVRNLTNGTPARFNLQAGDLCYAQAQGDIQPIINPDGPNGAQPSSGNTPMPPAMPRPRPARTSTSSTSASGTRPWTGRRPATTTTGSSRSTSRPPLAGSGPRWCCGSSTSRAASWTGWCSPGSPAALRNGPCP